MSGFIGSSGPAWQVVEQVPVEETLFDVVHTTDGPYAVGESGTLLANRAGDDGGWAVVVDAGPATKNSKLTAAAATSDGKRLWFLGSGGSLGCFDVPTGRKYDYSFPMGMTSSWQALTVGGAAGSEMAMAANGSGEVLPFTLDGFDVDWGEVTTPTAGANITALGSNRQTAYAVDGAGNVYETTPDEGWEKIGISDAQVSLHDVWVGENQRVYVAGGDGRLYRYDDSARDWTPIDVAETVLYAVDVYEDAFVVLGGDGDIYQRTVGGDRWSRSQSPVNATLYGLALGHPDVAVGKSGTILVRNRPGAAGESPASETDETGETASGAGPGAEAGPRPGSGQRGTASSGESGETPTAPSGGSDGATEPSTDPAAENGAASQSSNAGAERGATGRANEILWFPTFESRSESDAAAPEPPRPSTGEPVLSFPGPESSPETTPPFEQLAENDVVLVLVDGC